MKNDKFVGYASVYLRFQELYIKFNYDYLI